MVSRRRDRNRNLGNTTADMRDRIVQLENAPDTARLVSGSSGSTQGIVGQQGVQGYQGTQGNLGTQGPYGSGTQGVQGGLGPTGVQGFQGVQGRQGLQGRTGTQGVQGVQGPSDGPPGPQGTTGTAGSQGVQGSIGIQGPADGPQGTTGSQGATGTQGSVGPIGVQGVQGIQGIQGFRGYQGILGTQGTDGLQGGFGPQGLTGIQGPLGIQGPADGPQGTTGAQGIQGVQGPQGIQGTQGIQGNQGLQGLQGFEGPGLYTYSDTPPVSPSVGDRWVHSTTLIEYTYINDGDSSQWVDIRPSGYLGIQGPSGGTGSGVGIPTGGATAQVLSKLSGADYDVDWMTVVGGSGATVAYQTTAPTSPSVGDVWVDSDASVLSSSIPFYDRRWVRGSTAYAQDDEFNDATLAGAWTRVDASGGSSRATWTEGADSLSVLLNGGDAAAELHALVKPYALAVGESIQTRIAWSGVGFNYPMGGLIVTDGTTYGAGAQEFACHIQATGTAGNLDMGSWTGFNTRAAWTDRTSYGLYQSYHMKLTRGASNVWSVYVSPDGVSWALYAQRTVTMTPSHVGFAVSSWTGAGPWVFSFEYFRVGT